MNKDSGMTARSFITALVDEGSFVEVDKHVRRSNAVYGYSDVSCAGEGVISGWGKVEGLPVCVFAQDESVLGGSMSSAQADKIVKAISMAAKCGYPIIARWSSKGARVQEGAAAVDAYIRVAKAINDVSGVVPTISIAAGEMFGTSCAFAAMTDFTIAIDKVSAAAVHPAMVIASKEKTDADAQKLAGSEVMAKENGIAQFSVKDEAEAIAAAKKLLSYLPQNNLESADLEISNDDAKRRVFASAEDTRALVNDICDAGSFFEVSKDFAPEMVTGFAMLDGISCGFVANDAGKEISSKAYKKAARFISILDAYDLPVITVINNEGSSICAKAVKCCQTANFAKLITAYATAGCAKIALVTGKAIGEGFAVMGARSCHDLLYVYPDAQLGALGEEAGSVVMYGKPGEEKLYKENFLSAQAALTQGVADDVVAPEDTRKVLISAINTAINKREEKPLRKHIIMPL